MKILVIGASRGIGLEIVRQGLEHGHEITALLRDPAKLERDHPRLRKIAGDAGSAADVRATVLGQDAVCSCVGIGPTRRPVDIFSRGAANVLRRSMEHEQNLSR